MNPAESEEDTNQTAGTLLESTAETATEDSGSSTALPQSEQSDEPRPAQRQYEYDLTALEELPQYSLQELFEFYQEADGAFSESAMAEMMERFSQNPSSFLSALAGVNEALQELIADCLGGSIFFSSLPEYQGPLYDA